MTALEKIGSKVRPMQDTVTPGGLSRGCPVQRSPKLFRQNFVRNRDLKPESIPDHRIILGVHSAYLEGRRPFGYLVTLTGEGAGYPLEMRDPDIIDSVLEEVEVDHGELVSDA
ncbi:hypothetical protein J6590_024202 [Homalodisca vitripennis]|nr:hypothetical protein J6590_024202 [Homalodisca vitripennis]